MPVFDLVLNSSLKLKLKTVLFFVNCCFNGIVHGVYINLPIELQSKTSSSVDLIRITWKNHVNFSRPHMPGSFCKQNPAVSIRQSIQIFCKKIFL